MNKKIINIKTIGVALCVVFLLLIFFSKTIYISNLPVITASKPGTGKLTKTESTTGIVDWANKEEVYSEIAGKVEDVLVKEGDIVTKGQPLFKMTYDEEDINKKLEDISINRKKYNLDIETINLKIKKATSDIEELKKETFNQDPVSDFDITQLESEIANAETTYNKLKVLYDAGGIAQKELDTANYDLENLRSKYDNAKKLLEEQNKKSVETVAEKEKNKQKSLTDLEFNLSSLKQDLKTKTLDLSNLAYDEKAYKENLDKFNKNSTIFSPQDGIVISLDSKKGLSVPENKLLLSIGIGNEFKIDCNVSLSNNFIVTGDKCNLSNSSGKVEGVVSKITPSENAKKISILITSDTITSGETFDIKFEKESTQTYTLIPNGAVNKDNDGYFVYIVKRRDGILGKEFYATKSRITIGDSDDKNTAVVKGMDFFEPIVLLSDKPFYENETIKLINESDFIEN